MKAHNVACYFTEATPGISVIGNVSHSLSCQVRAANRQDAIPDNFRHPRKQSMRDDVIKLSQLAGKSHYIKLLQRDIFQSQRRNQIPSLRDGASRKINADKATLGQIEGQGNKVSTRATSHFKDATRFNGRPIHPEQSRYRRQSIRMRLRIDVGRIIDFIVGSTIDHSHIQRYDVIINRESVGIQTDSISNDQKVRNET